MPQAIESARRAIRMPVGAVVWAMFAAVLLAPVAHGCHGPDEDHEPGVAPTRLRADSSESP